MAISKLVIAVCLMALMACAAAQGPEPTGDVGRGLKYYKGDKYDKGFKSDKGFKVKDWFEDYKDDFEYRGKFYRYIIFKGIKLYFQDFCGDDHYYCFDDKHIGYKEYKGKKDKCDKGYEYKYYKC